MKITFITLFLALAVSPIVKMNAENTIDPENNQKWQMVWSDNFDYKNRAELLKVWEAQNAPNTHILCSRWEENIEVGNGTVKLINKKEERGGQSWTSGSMWTREKFQYGYYECRYKYASIAATNNSFWLMTQGADPTEGKRFEIDINEGHYPNSVNTNIHNWSDITINPGKKNTHPTASKSFIYGGEPAYTFQLEIPVKATKVRFSSNHADRIHIGEFRIYGVNPAGYPSNPLAYSVDKQVSGLVNYARLSDTKVSCSGVYQDNIEQYGVKNVSDDNNTTRWISQPAGEKWIEFNFEKPETVGCIQFTNGWYNKTVWANMLKDFKVDYWDGRKWMPIGSLGGVDKAINLSKEYHTYGLDWSAEELIFYFDRKEIRREKNTFCYSPSPVWLSLAIIAWNGPIVDAINGTQMEVDYVKIFKKK
jgi:beta-glucanase (GH16 family)